MYYNLFDRPYYDQMLDLDKSSGVIPSGIIDQYRFIYDPPENPLALADGMNDGLDKFK